MLLEHEARDASPPLNQTCSENGGKSSDNNGASCEAQASTPDKEVAYLRSLLKAILISAAPPPAAAPVTAPADVHHADVASARLSSADAAPPSCGTFNSCSSCIAATGCAWCLAARSCRTDAAWQCQGDIDHVSHSGIGRHARCPSVQVGFQMQLRTHCSAGWAVVSKR